ncbi:MAG: calcium/sodium antiporter [Gemmatimonadota bacterium]
MGMAFAMVGLGLVVLVLGAEVLVRGASRLAARFGVTPLVIGLTVVAFGTSAPELAVNLQAAFAGQGSVGLGNVLGSNVFNTLLILGLAATFAPLRVQASLVRFEVPLVLVASVGAYTLAIDHVVSRADGILLLLGMVGYSLFMLGSTEEEAGTTAAVEGTGEERESGAGEAARPIPGHVPAAAVDPAASSARAPGAPMRVSVLLVLGGLVLLVGGSRALVWGAVRIAESWGVSPLLIGLTIVAGGTSLPELATSVVASLRGQIDIAVGNVLGSNLFNLLFVLGGTATIQSGGIDVPDPVLAFDFPVLLGVAVACFPIFLTRLEISRREGVVFVLYYGVYLLYLILDATGHALFGGYRAALLFFVLPLTALILALTSLGAWRERRAADAKASSP